MALTEPVKALLREAARVLAGSERRRLMARTVEAREPGLRRVTIRKEQRELAGGFRCVGGFALRGRKRAEAHLPDVLADLAAIGTGQNQADPTFRTTRRRTRLTAAEVRRQPIAQKGYSDAALPCVQTIGATLNALGDHPQPVAKAAPQQRSPRPTPSSPR